MFLLYSNICTSGAGRQKEIKQQLKVNINFGVVSIIRLLKRMYEYLFPVIFHQTF
jgi:hypothetical protein